jgi:hypothetical protein
MVRKTLFSIALAAVFCALVPVSIARATPDAMPMPADRVADSYAIYSMLMPGAPFDSMAPQQNQRWAIADTTVNISDMNPAIPPEGQLKAPEKHAKGFHEAVRDFETRKNQRIQLTEQFQLAQPYMLFTASQVDEFRKARATVDAGSALQDKYAGYPGVTFFSQVYFSANHHEALVYMNNWCANLCAQGQWIYLEKHGGNWERRSGIYEKMS